MAISQAGDTRRSYRRTPPDGKQNADAGGLSVKKEMRDGGLLRYTTEAPPAEKRASVLTRARGYDNFFCCETVIDRLRNFWAQGRF